MATISENLKTIKDSTADIKQAIIEKGGEVGDLATYADAIRGIQTESSSSIWTGHVDVEGLKAIGWDDEDIAYFQKHGVNWMEEDDEYYKVSDDNKALYGVLTANNIQEYKDRIVWLPKIDFSDVTTADNRFRDCKNMIGIPLLDFSECTSMNGAFVNCYRLTCIPRLDINKIKSIYNCFANTYSLQYLPSLKFSSENLNLSYTFQSSFIDSVSLSVPSCGNASYMFYTAYSIKAVLGNLNTGMTKLFNNMFFYCRALKTIEPVLDMSSATDISSFSTSCNVLEHIYIKKLPLSISFSGSHLLSKESVLYMIDNEAATSAITITLHADAYARLANDPDIVAALSNHPNVSLASA